MPKTQRLFLSLATLLLILQPEVAWAQQPHGHEDAIAQPVPPPLPRRPPPDKNVPAYDAVIPKSDKPWVMGSELLEQLFEKAEVYFDYTSRFTCDETARLADYNAEGEASSEKARNYGYLLTRNDAGKLREYRQRLTKDGTVKANEIDDEEPFPPAYAWVFLFSRFHEPSFSYRYIGDRFDGFDWIHEIQFRGSHPFSDGKDIRQWEGTVLLDAVTFTPIEILAEPAGQRDRIEALYRQYSKSFNIMGFRTKPKPLGYRADIQFRYRRDGLTFPTELRYDTFRAVSVTQVVPTKASTRLYDHYRIYKTDTKQEIGKVGG